ncbi:hypothetical protein COU74_02500 [Candidatus Peregrinibacteria bacterium CG10_big_fil_rev_8_21_14_0_10_36_19]|nr:MAG: hypothetical protein COU74_02500 [Candidatus Peregrinibacteria bacterium CG10_big_fil_rev_8_21_14_0_10_36_19]
MNKLLRNSVLPAVAGVLITLPSSESTVVDRDKTRSQVVAVLDEEPSFPCTKVTETGEIGDMFREIVSNRESKKYNYTLHGIQFASDTITEAELKKDLDKAVELVGGPYWKPVCPYVVESTVHKMNDTQNLCLTDNESHASFSSNEGRTHELIHVIIGPVAKNWPYIMGEFFAHAASPKTLFDYSLSEMNDPSISMVDHTMIITPANNYFLELRHIALRKLSQSMTNEKRIAMLEAAFKRGKINFEDLADFGKEFGIDHAIFQKGTPGIKKHAFKGNYNGKTVIQFVTYSAQEDNDYPVDNMVMVGCMDENGKKIDGTQVMFQINGIHLMQVDDFLAQTKTPFVKSIYVVGTDGWNQVIEL